MRVLIIGSLDGQIGAASKIAMERGATVSQADDVATGLQHLRLGKGADLVLVHVTQDLPGLMASLKDERMAVPVVACGIGTDAEAAVRAIKAGAKESIPLPPSAELIAAVLAAVAEDDNTIVFRDPAFGKVLETAKKIAPSNASVLITGESGTGKELLARFVHNNGRRAAKRFVAVNCAAIPENLLESELFGHEKGAFTGAVARRIGKFEEANGGTLLLDEISEMDSSLQAKLLRVVQESEIDRLGASRPVKVDVRIVATSNRNLPEEVAKGAFREDLYFRLNVIPLRLPPLRERPGDIETLAEHFVIKHAEANDMPQATLSDGALNKLRAYSWPGNVRELENAIHRALLLSTEDEIGADGIQLSGLGASPAAGASDAEGKERVGRTVAEVERELIIDTLQHCLGNRTHAANILGISIRTLRNKLKQYTEMGFAVPTPGEGARPNA